MSGREGSSCVRPPLLEKGNYNYWKGRMQAFICMQDEDSWNMIEDGYTKPTVAGDRGAVVTKMRSQYTAEEKKLDLANSKALYFIIAAVPDDQYGRISNCTTAKEAWDILKAAHEGTDSVKKSKLQFLSSQFEGIRMGDEEDLQGYARKLRDIANKAFQLGEKYSDEKLILKIIRTLPDKFHAKATAIETAKDLSTMSLDEFMGQLQAYEMNYDQNKRDKGLFLQVSTANPESEQVESDDLDEDVALLTKNFGRMLNRMGRRNQMFQSNPNRGGGQQNRNFAPRNPRAAFKPADQQQERTPQPIENNELKKNTVP